MKRTQLKQRSQLVEDFKWDEATKVFVQHFPGGSTNIKLFVELLPLVIPGKSPDNLVSIIEWVGQLDVQFQPGAYNVLFEIMNYEVKRLP
jgi:hypothetical protein